MTSRPKIAIAGRRAESTSASRRSALISSERLVEAVWQAGGDPLVYLPVVDSDYAQRLSGISGILVPGGGDVDPSFYGQEPTTDAIYGVDKVSDAFDLGLIRYAIDNAIPLLAICRGAQLVNVACGGTLIQDLQFPHTNKLHLIKVDEDVNELGLSTDIIFSSCYHHQAVDKLGDGLHVISHSSDGLVEAFRIESQVWSYAVQWHPEDNWREEEDQFGIFKKFVAEAVKLSA